MTCGRLLVDDGRIALRVTGVADDDVTCLVTEGGPVSNNKGISLPGVDVSVPALSDKDIEDLRFALRLQVDTVAMSFVRFPEEVKLVHAVMDELGPRIPVIAKLEKPEAVRDLDGIIAAFDGIMVARGDLGVEMPLEQIPLIQKRTIQRCRGEAKPVIEQRCPRRMPRPSSAAGPRGDRRGQPARPAGFDERDARLAARRRRALIRDSCDLFDSVVHTVCFRCSLANAECRTERRARTLCTQSRTRRRAN